MNRIIVNHGFFGGLLAGILLTAPLLLMRPLTIDTQNYGKAEIYAFAVILLSSIATISGIYVYRRKFPQRTYNFYRVFKICMSMSLIGYLVFFLCNLLVFELISPAVLLHLIADMQQLFPGENNKMAASGAGLQHTHSFTTALWILLPYFLCTLILSIIAGLLWKRK